MGFKLTKASVDNRCRPPQDGEVNGRGKPVQHKFYWDTELKGFALVVGKTTKTFIVQRDIRGRSVRVKVGRFGVWTVDEARRRARELIVQMDKGIDPNREKRVEAAKGTTLAEAVEWHVTSMRAKGCVERSADTLRWEVKHHLGDWADRALASITTSECARRHDRITRGCGPYAANHALRTFRACWNTAARRLDDLPQCPVRAVTFNKESRRREPIAWEGLPEWKAGVDGIQNPIRRDLQYFILLTGLRSTDAKTVRWEDVDLEAGTIHRPKPKGGRAFTVPVAAAVLEILHRRRKENAIIYPRDGGWVFPSRDMKGGVTHVKQVKEQRYVGEQKLTTFPSPHRLRDTFATAGLESGVDPLSLKALMNHVLPAGDITAGYIRPSTEHLRAQVEKVAAFLLERMGGSLRERP